MQRKKGYTYAFTALLFLIVWPIFSKIGFGYFNYQTTIVLWFGTAAVFSFLMILYQGRLKEYETFKTHWKWILVQGFTNTAGVFASWYALDKLGAGMHNFVSKVSIVFMVLAGILFLGERFSIKEALGGLTILIGVFLISHIKGQFVLIGVVFIIIWAILFSLQNMIVKAKLKDVKPLLIVNYRAVSITIFSLIITIITGKLNIYLTKGLLFATLPAILSAVMAHIFIYRAYKLIEMSKLELIMALQPFLVLVISYFVFGEVFTIIQFFGGFLIISGVVGLVFTKKQTNDVSIG